ncbi:S8 family peptidase [Sphaerisporangium fuscum]|uniref:S8 family peptidase n=1 Tax=Sphaerisporangium fuscum TaxID=2835868 RepID=UPI001BDDC541|nr:S8 family peptidase [Sphaerisporangium fuscum]
MSHSLPAVLAAGALAALSSLVPLTGASAEPVTGHVVEVRDPIPGRYIVVLKDGTTMTRPSDLAARYGGRVRHAYTSALKGYAAEMTAAEAGRLAADPRVAFVEQDSEVAASGTQPDPPSWGLDRVDQRDLPLDHSYGYPSTAPTVTAYILDTGIRTSHRQFGGRASVGADEVGDGRDGQDCAGHGTHVSGTVGGTDYGVAKQVKLVAVRVLDCSGHGSASTVIAGVDWITAHAVKPAVVNMSLNGTASNSEDAAINKSISSGVTYVVSSGNGNTDACKNSPGRISAAIVVDNADSRDRRASDSNYGSCTDLFAPGVGITSAWNSGDTATKTIGGTSMAAPHVTGAAALYLAGHPGATPAEVQNALTAAATTGKITNAGSGSPNRLLFVSP